MPIIDSDAHTIEYDHTWDFMDESEQAYRPAPRPLGQGQGRGHGDKVVLPDECRNPVDVAARVRHMDELGTDVQVLYPTLFISPYTSDPGKELAMARSYNRWVGDISQQSQGRMRWVVAPPLRSMDACIEELRWGKQHGACGVMMRGVEIENKLLSDPYFFPMYEEAQRLDLPVCIHTGSASEEISQIYGQESGFCRFKLVGIGACHNLLYTKTPENFPQLRWGFIELSAQWVPYVLNDFVRRFDRAGKSYKPNVFRDNNIFITCQTTDDLPVILDIVGEDVLVIGTDYGHADSSTEIFALQTFRENETVPVAARRKILDNNARELYGLS
jgi:predicted TIM-barrel fold metal-dependent hydrolase